LQLYRYIELNPLRANMVDDPADYKWSSYQVNALGKITELCTPHELYLGLGKNKEERQERYQGLFNLQIDGELLSGIRKALQQGLAIGNQQFKLDIEKLTGCRMRAEKTGRPKK